jgi:hypothetical protein
MEFRGVKSLLGVLVVLTLGVVGLLAGTLYREAQPEQWS